MGQVNFFDYLKTRIDRVISASDPRSGRGLPLKFGHQQAEDCSYDLHAHGTTIPGDRLGEGWSGARRMAREQPCAQTHSDPALKPGRRAG